MIEGYINTEDGATYSLAECAQIGNEEASPEIVTVVSRLVRKVFNVIAVMKEPDRQVLCNRIRESLLSLLVNVSKSVTKIQGKRNTTFLRDARENIIEVQTLIQLAIQLDYMSSQSVKNITSLLNETIEKLDPQLIKKSKINARLADRRRRLRKEDNYERQ